MDQTDCGNRPGDSDGFFQSDDGNFGPDAEAAGKGEEAEAAVDIEIPIFFMGKARPVEVAVLGGAPSELVGFDAELRSVGMTGQGEVDGGGVVPDLFFPVGGVV